MWRFIILFLSCTQLATAQGSRFAVRFYGTGTGQIDRIKIPLAASPALNVGSNFTVEFWMRANYADNAGIVASGQNGDGWITGNVIIDRDVYGGGDYGDFGIALGRDSSRSVLAFGAHNGSWGETIVGTHNVGDGIWHHVAATRRQTDGVMRIYVDGTLDAEGVGPTGNLAYRTGRSTSWPNSDPFFVIGAEKHDAGSEYPSFYGSVDELRVWSRVLEAEELSAVASNILPPFEQTELSACFRLEEGTNQVVNDSAMGYTGTLYSAQPGNGEWTSWQVGSNAAPIQSYRPTLSLPSVSNNALTISWFIPHNIQSDLETAESLTNNATWSPWTSATNLTAEDSNVTVTISTELHPHRFIRAKETPYR